MSFVVATSVPLYPPGGERHGRRGRRALAAAALLLLAGCPEERPGVEKRIPGERFPPAEALGSSAGGTPELFRRREGAPRVELRRDPGSATLEPAPVSGPAEGAPSPAQPPAQP